MLESRSKAQKTWTRA